MRSAPVLEARRSRVGLKGGTSACRFANSLSFVPFVSFCKSILCVAVSYPNGISKLTDTTLDDDAAALITSGKAPYTGTWKVADLSKFEGQPLQGTWTLEIVDSKRKNVATLKSWSMTVEWET